MPTISNLPSLTTATNNTIFLVVDESTGLPTSKKATFNQLTSFFESSVAVRSVAGRQGDVVLTYTDINGTPKVATSSTIGAVKAGTGLLLNGDGSLSVGGSVALLIKSNTPPTGAVQNDIWYDGVSGRLYVYYNYAWVDASPGTKTPSSITATTQLSLSSDIQSVSSTTGALIVAGGAGIGGDIYVNGNIVANSIKNQGTSDLVVTTDNGGSVIFASGTQVYISDTGTSYTPNTGALVVGGSVGIGGNVVIGNTLTVLKNIIGVITTATTAILAYNAVTATNLTNGTWTAYISSTGTLVIPNNLQVINTQIVNNIVVNTETITGSIVFPDSSVQTTAFGLTMCRSVLLTDNPPSGFTSGVDNIAIGYDALLNNTTGCSNLALGYEAVCSNITGCYNIGLGYRALAGTIGSNNIAVGYSALFANTTGCANIGIGYNAGCSITTGSGNVVIGSYTGADISTNTGTVVIADGLGSVKMGFTSTGALFFGSTVTTFGSSGQALISSGKGGSPYWGNIIAPFNTATTMVGLATTATSLATAQVRIYINTLSNALLPSSDSTVDLGSTSTRFRTLYITSSTIDLGGTPLSAVSGQLAVSGNIVASNTGTTASFFVSNITQSTATNTGALVVAGGVGVGGNLYARGTGSFNGNLSVGTTNNTLTQVTIYNATTASLGLYGGGGVGSGSQTANIYLGDATFNTAARWNQAPGIGALYDSAPLGGVMAGLGLYTYDTIIANTRTLRIGIDAYGRATVYSTVIATSTNTGALQVVGGIGIGGALFVGNTATIVSAAKATSTTTGALQVVGGVGIGQNLYVANSGTFGGDVYDGRGQLATRSFSIAISIAVAI